VGIPPFFKGSVSAMGRAAARGQVLLQSPVVFQPVAQHPFPVRLCVISAFSGFITAFVVFIAWIWTL
jgi:hypothetical protein